MLLLIVRLGLIFLIGGQVAAFSNEFFASPAIDPQLVFESARRLAKTWEADRAIQRFEEAAELFAAAGMDERSSMSNLMAAETAYSAGDNVKAKTLADRVLADPISDPSTVKIVAYSILSLIAYQTGKKADAERWCNNARGLITDNTPNHARALSHFSSGIYQYFYGDVRTANTDFEDAVKFSAESVEPFVLTQSLFYSGFSQLRLGNTLPALNLMREALARSEQLGYQRGVALAHREIGYIHFYLGERQVALDSFRTSELMLPRQGAVIERARVFNAIGLVYRDFDDLMSAERYFEDAEESFISAGYPLGALTALLNLCDLYTRVGQADRARRSYLLAQERAEDLGDEFQMSLAAEGLGKLELFSKNFDNAVNHFKRSLALTKKSGTDSNTISELLGAAYELKGDLRRARIQYNFVLAVNDRMGNTIYRAKNLFDLARLDYLEGSFQSSFDRMLESLRLTEEVYASVDSASLRRSYLGHSQHRFELMSVLTAQKANVSKRPEDVKQSLIYLERARARSLSDNLRINNSRISTPEDQARLFHERHLLASLTAKNDRLTNLRLRDRNDPEVHTVEVEISRILEDLDDIRSSDQRDDPNSSLIRKPTDFDLTGLQRDVLDADEVLIAYFLSETESYLWLADRTTIEVYPLSAGNLIEKAVDSLNERLQTQASASERPFEERAETLRFADAEYAAAARNLSDIILGPVAEKIQGKRLIMVPDGKLNYFPISALPMPNSESDDPILLTNEVIYQPSAQTYVLLKKIGQERKDENAKDLLVFSDPVFNPADERLTGIEIAAKNNETTPYRFRLVESFSSLSRLPASRNEAETVSKAVGGSDLFMGFDATRERLLSTNLADYKVIHLATHGFLDPERPELSSLVFSRYDQTGQQLDESIRMHDIYSMKLNADLVVLSACQTGTGKEVKGEGVMGLNTAFLQAGARSVVSTLWQVEDNAANHLMKEFYERMAADGMSPSAALRAAQIKLYQDPQFRSPFFWAAFTVHGDAAGATPFKRTHTKPVIGISIAVLLGVGLILLRRRYRISKV